jgi:hypothetical protein
MRKYWAKKAEPLISVCNDCVDGLIDGYEELTDIIFAGAQSFVKSAAYPEELKHAAGEWFAEGHKAVRQEWEASHGSLFVSIFGERLVLLRYVSLASSWRNHKLSGLWMPNS